MPTNSMKRCSIYAPEKLFKLADKLADNRGLSRNQIVLQALEEYVERNAAELRQESRRNIIEKLAEEAGIN